MPFSELLGIHHLTAVTANAAMNKRFYTETLGLRLVKKTVNQDDPSAYHLFYADGEGSPGTDITFFEWAMEREKRGTRSIVSTGLRVRSEATLAYWADRLGAHEYGTVAGRTVLDVEDPEGQRLRLTAAPPTGAEHAWEQSEVPEEHQVLGLGPITISVPAIDATRKILTDVMGMREVGEVEDDLFIFEMSQGGPAAELHVEVDVASPRARLGAGGAHHVAFRVRDDAYDAWAARLQEMGVANSGPVDRFYFRSLYFREPGGVLFELATDGPGFHADEPKETMGERLSLAPFLEPQRERIERGLKPLE